MKQLVIGRGEIGTALAKILECDSYDALDKDLPADEYDTLHICFPYSPTFLSDVRAYAIALGAELVIVHSTVPLGTCDPEGWVHSPVRGIHPHLEKGIRTFVKFLGGDGAHDAAKIFRKAGIKTSVCLEARDTEALKLWDTTIYGWNILLEKAIKAYCDLHKLDFRTVYTYANTTYNSGYDSLGRPEYVKYVLKDAPGPIGGHCVQQNWELLEDPIAALSKKLHKRFSDV